MEFGQTDSRGLPTAEMSKGLWFSGWWLNLGGFFWVSVLSPSIQESLWWISMADL